MKKTLLGLLLIVILGGGCGGGDEQNEDMEAIEKDNSSEGVGLYDVDDERIGALITIAADRSYIVLNKKGYLFRVSGGGSLMNSGSSSGRRIIGNYYFDNICEDGPYTSAYLGPISPQHLIKVTYLREIGTYPYTDYADIFMSEQIALIGEQIGEQISDEQEVFEKQANGNPVENIETVVCEEVTTNKPSKLYEINHMSEEDSGAKLSYPTPLTIKKDKK